MGLCLDKIESAKNLTYIPLVGVNGDKIHLILEQFLSFFNFFFRDFLRHLHFSQNSCCTCLFQEGLPRQSAQVHCTPAFFKPEIKKRICFICIQDGGTKKETLDMCILRDEEMVPGKYRINKTSAFRLTSYFQFFKKRPKGHFRGRFGL